MIPQYPLLNRMTSSGGGDKAQGLPCLTHPAPHLDFQLDKIVVVSFSVRTKVWRLLLCYRAGHLGCRTDVPRKLSFYVDIFT